MTSQASCGSRDRGSTSPFSPVSFVSEAHSSPSPTAGATLTGRTFHSVFQSCRLALRRSRGHDEVARCVRDASPDGWGRRSLATGCRSTRGRPEPGLRGYRLLSRYRIGALDFQTSPTEYVHRTRLESRLMS